MHSARFRAASGTGLRCAGRPFGLRGRIDSPSIPYDQGRALKRAQYPEDLVGTVLYLLSDAGDFVTGQSFDVDGGRMMH